VCSEHLRGENRGKDVVRQGESPDQWGDEKSMRLVAQPSAGGADECEVGEAGGRRLEERARHSGARGELN